MNSKILIVEDDAVIRRELKLLLENAMYRVAAPEDFEDIPVLADREEPDLILLDVNLPGCSGFDLCMDIREKTDTPIIFLTGRTDSMDELNGMLKGGDDYIRKPCPAPLLLARIAAVLKRTARQESVPPCFVKDGVRLDISRCCLIWKDAPIDLTRTEMKIFHRLFQTPGEFVARAELVEELWENQIFIDDNTLSVHITRLREKLRSAGITDFIETKRGLGYRI
ncbi:MAG: response regulator transcription factor [Acetatifactor sp.]|nr:response regulator transcription factor [Acetatifactor sp.]MDE7351830.1 response regulator transcription factor [Acetatifactor sp.]